MAETTKYVVGFLFAEDVVLLVRKLRPSWQAGLLNGIGGHVESGESFDDAMAREFKEETGLAIEGWVHFATIGGDGWTMGCYRASGTEQEVFGRDGRHNDVGERMEVRETAHIVAGQFSTIPNLRWLIPMADPNSSHDWPYHIIERAPDAETAEGGG